MNKDFIFFGRHSDSWRDLVEKAGLYGFPSSRSVANYLGVSTRTVERWIKANDAPDYAWRLLLFITGDMGAVYPDWEGWRVVKDELYDPHGFRVNKTTFEHCNGGGTLVSQARRQALDAERKLSRFTEILAGFMVHMSTPKPKTVRLRGADGTEYVLPPELLLPAGR